MSQHSHIQIPFNTLIHDILSFIVEREKKMFLANVIVCVVVRPPSFRGTGLLVLMLPGKDVINRAPLWHEETLSVQ